MIETVNIKINGKDLTVPVGTTILEAARHLGIHIPTLCYLKEINAIGACRICVVEVKGAKTLMAACVHPVSEGMEITTDSPRVFNSRKTTLELILSTHKKECLSCVRSDNCELQKLCHVFKVEDENKYQGFTPSRPIDDSAVHLFRDNNKCILCRRCIAACAGWQGLGVIGANDRGFETHISCAFDLPLDKVSCVSCGQCIVVCPTGAIAEKDHSSEVWEALADHKKHVIVQTAPSIRATLGEAFGFPPGTDVTGKMVAALKRLGFDRVFDTNLAADMTIVEEANELIERVQKKGVLPLITSCSPGWVKYCEYYYPDMIPHLSTCKSPQQMFGATVKTWYAEKMNWDPKNIFVVGIMPCTAKKFEVSREDQSAAGFSDVDVSLTTRELSRMIDRAGICFAELPDDEFDNPMGESTGAATIFGATGGVMEAALRTAAEWIESGPSCKAEFRDVRGTEGFKEAIYTIGGLTLNVVAISGLANVRKVMDDLRAGVSKYDFIEVMCCPGGCINGGGQPVQPASVRNFIDLKAKRAEVLYHSDSRSAFRKSHENTSLEIIYKEFFGKYGSKKAHEILHTSYKDRSVRKYSDNIKNT